MLTISIVPEDELPEFLAARERGEMVSAEDIMAEGFRYATSADDAGEEPADAEESADVAEEEAPADAEDAISAVPEA